MSCYQFIEDPFWQPSKHCTHCVRRAVHAPRLTCCPPALLLVFVVWSRLCGRKDGRVQPGDIGDLLQLRQHMGHLTDNLQVYLQLDVVESNFDLLLQQVEAAQVGRLEDMLLACQMV